MFCKNDNYVALFQDPVLVGLLNVRYLGTSAKLLYFETEIATFVQISLKKLLFETQITQFVWISNKFASFDLKCYNSWESTNLLLLV